MTRILLTNDDGAGSPALVPFARSLTQIGEVTVCVPHRDRSWIGKAISRVEDVAFARTERDGIEIFTASGYPADAAQLGIHVASPERPDVVVSGINLGFNHGTAFLMSSGTVGAAIEGWISGHPAVAFSTGVFGRGYEDWRRHAESPDAAQEWAALADTCATILADLRHSGIFDHADVVSVNLPFDATAGTPRRVTSIARVGYDRLFRAVAEDVYRHDFSGVLQFGELDGTDVQAARDSVVSICPVRLPTAQRVPDDVRRTVEQ
jgi:5'-nucleotidase